MSKKRKRVRMNEEVKEVVVHTDVVETTTTPDGQVVTKETKTDADVTVNPQ